MNKTAKTKDTAINFQSRKGGKCCGGKCGVNKTNRTNRTNRTNSTKKLTASVPKLSLWQKVLAFFRIDG
jgi:hypothetical protein